MVEGESHGISLLFNSQLFSSHAFNWQAINSHALIVKVFTSRTAPGSGN